MSEQEKKPSQEKQPPYNDRGALKAKNPLTADEIIDFMLATAKSNPQQEQQGQQEQQEQEQEQAQHEQGRKDEIDQLADFIIQRHPNYLDDPDDAAHVMADLMQFTLTTIAALGIQSDQYADKVREFTKNAKATDSSPDTDTDDFLSIFNDSVMEYMSEVNINPDPGILSDLYRDTLDELQKRASTNSIGARRAKNINYPIDKPNSTIWNMLEENTHGQLEIKAEPNSSKKEVDILYSINFDVIESDFPIVKRLTQYDKRVYIAAGALWDAGNNIVTTAQIYHAMGYTGTPGAADKEKIDKSFTKFTARITINNDQEIKAGYKYPRFDYDGDLLPFERVREHDVINGQLTESTIHLFREPPLMSFARGRKQLTTYPLKVLQSPNSKTERNLAIEDYLLERIARAKNGTEPQKILLSTLYDHAHITTKMQRSRAPQTIASYLDYYKSCGEIKDYTMDKTSITLILNAPPKKKRQPSKKKKT